MRKAVLIVLILGFAFTGCRDGTNRGYSYATYTNANTAAGGVQPQSSYSRYYYPVYNGYPYNTYYDPNYGYYYYYYNPYYGYYQRRSYYRHHCEVNLAILSPDGVETRALTGEKLRAETFGARTEVEYGDGVEKINFLSDAKGNTYLSGKVKVGEEIVTLDPKTQKCTSTREAFKDDPSFQLAKFDCTGSLNIKAEALIAYDQQHAEKLQ